MRHFRTLGLGAVIGAFTGLPTAADPLPRLDPISGQVVSVRQGENIVFVGAKDTVRVVALQDLKAGDLIQTNEKGAMAIVFADQMQIRLARNSTLLVKRVSKGTPSEIEMQKGSLWARAPRSKSQLTLKTPSATAAIRGTEWGLRVDGGETRLEVVSGSVELFNDQGNLSIEAGEAAAAKIGQAPVRIVVVNRGKREQMLYYLSRDFFPDALSPSDPLFSAYEAALIGEFDAALSYLAAQDFSNVPAASVLRAKIGFLMGDETGISEALTAGLKAFPGTPDLISLNAEYLAAYVGRPDRALVEAQRAVDLAPNNHQSLLVLSRIYLERRMELAAMEVIERAIETAPKLAELYVQKADIYLRQNRPQAAKTALEKARALSPDLPTARLGLGQIHALDGDNEAALEQALAASADNPAYALGLLRLAEIYGRMGDGALANQQLDAADRLDPNSPYTPLYRTALALHQYEGSAGIEGAQEALSRFQARGGLYENLSENRETGSNISRAFRFMELEAWGRYYGDRVFDSFSATSYFDQTLNETPGPFFIRGEDTSFNPQNGDDLEEISNYIQGVILDPLSVAQSGRKLQIAKESFLEAELGGTAIVADTSDLIRGSASLQGRFYTGDGESGLPIAFSLVGKTSRAEQNTLDQTAGAGIDLIDETSDNAFIQAYAGLELTARDHIVAFATVRKDELTVREDPGFLLPPGQVSTRDEDSFFGLGFWNHHFTDRNHVTVGGGYGETKSAGGIIDDNGPRLDESSRTSSYLFFANHTRAFGDLDVKIGAEGYWNDTDLGFVTQDTDEVRLYVDGRYQLSEHILLQGQIGALRRDDDSIGQNGERNTDLEYHLGVAYEPVRGHWVRAALIQETQITTPFSLAPIQTLGLKGNLTPTTRGEELKSKIFRWDAEWTDRMFTSLEFQDQEMGRLLYFAPDGRQVASLNSGELQRWSASLNYIVGHNLAASLDYTQTDSRGVRGLRVGERLPFVPKRTARAALVWTHPKRVSVKLAGNYVGEQESSIFDFTMRPGTPIEDYFTADILARWEPWNKSFEFSAGLLNMFDNEHQVTVNVPAPGRAVFVAAKARF